MMRAAVQAASESGGTKPLVIAVTVLTSIDTAILNNELGVASTAQEQVVRLALLAKESGCDGVVASPLEVAAIREACGKEFLIITPGVRPAGADVGDQKRVMTPADAIHAGSSYLVIGRPINAAPDPKAAAESILAEIRGMPSP
jgi:orotidine-5'-phosphate decarboxylase